MNFAIRRAPIIIVGFLSLVGRPDTAAAQSKEELVDRYRAQCLAQFAHLRGQGPEAVRAAVRPCVVAKMQSEGRTIIVTQLQPLWDRVDNLLETGNLKDAEATAKSAIAKATELAGADSPGAAAGYGLLGKALSFQGRFREAEQLALKALRIVEGDQGNNSPRVARLCSLVAYALSNQGQQSEAENYYNRALAIQERDPGPDHPDTAVTLINFAVLRLEQGRLAEAVKLALRAGEINEKALGPKKAATARALAILGTILRRDARYAEAEGTLKRALAMWDAAFNGQHIETAITLRRLAEVYADTGRLAEAAALLERSLETLQKTLGADHRHTLMAMRELGGVKIKTGQAHDSELILRQAIPAAEKVLGRDHVELYMMHTSLGVALQKQEQFKDAEAAVRNGLAVAEHIGKESAFVCGALQALGSLYSAQDRLNEATGTLERAVAVCQQSVGPTHVRTASALRRLAEVNLLNNEPGQALEQLKRVTAALESRRESSGLIDGRHFNNEVGPLLRNVAISLATAAWQLEPTDGQVKVKYAEDGLLGAQLLAQSTAAAAITQMGARAAANDDALGRLVRQGQDLLHRWEAIDRQLTAGFEDGSGDVKVRQALRAELDQTDKELSAVGRRIAAEFPEYAALTRPTALRIEEAQKLLGPDEVLVTFLIEDKQSFVWAVTKTKSSWAKLKLSPKAIGEKVAALRCGLDPAAWEDDANACVGLLKVAYDAASALLGQRLPFDLSRAHDLYRALFGEVENLIEGKHLLIVPSGPLTALPFPVLVTEPPGSAIPADASAYADAAWLAKQNAVTILPSVSSLRALRQLAKTSKATQPFLGFGNPLLTGPRGSDRSAWSRQSCRDRSPDLTQVASRSVRETAPTFFRSGLANVSLIRNQWPLPETADELCAVAQSTGAAEDAVHLGEKATETTIKTLSANGALGNARVVHFATHGLLAGETGQLFASKAEPSLVLTPPEKPTEKDDGLLTASEVAQLRLDADWVVLSACNTASGGSDNPAAETLSGLARAFFYAGARALLVSHWAVASQATVDLIVNTFSTLKTEPKIGRAEALRRSMLTLIASGGRNAHPGNWAPFVVVGEGAR